MGFAKFIEHLFDIFETECYNGDRMGGSGFRPMKTGRF